MSLQERGGQRESKDRERERSPSACVEHAVIRDEPGHGRKREVTEKENRGGIQRRKCKSMLDGSHTKANHRKRSRRGNDVCQGDFLTPSSHLFSHFYQWKKKHTVRDGLTGLGTFWTTINASEGVIMVFDKCT